MILKMDAPKIIEVLQGLLRDEGLTRENFGRRRHMIDARRKPLNPVFASVARMVKNCIGGAVIKSLGVRGYIDQDQGPESTQYCAVMCALADTLGVGGNASNKIRGVQTFNNTHEYEEVIQLVKDTIKRLEENVQKKLWVRH